MLSGSRQVLSENKENSHTGGLLLGGAGLSLLQGCGDDEASGMKGSFASSSGSSAVGQVAGSSKAVLAALRALQDKIRRLEIERSQALEEATQLRQQVKHLEVEIEHTKQREALANHKVMAEATATKERLYTEKAELEVKLARSEDRVKEQSKHISELEYRQRGVDDKLKVVEEEKTKGDARIKDLASQLAQAAAKEREVSQTILWETRRHEDEIQALQGHIASLTQDLTSALEDREQVDAKRVELDELVVKLLGSNEGLVHQLESTERKLRAATEKSKKKFVEEASEEAAVHTRVRFSAAKLGKAAPGLRVTVKKTSKRGTSASAPASTGRGKGASSSSSSGSKKAPSSFKRPKQLLQAPAPKVPHCAFETTAAAEAQRVAKVSAPEVPPWVPGGMRGMAAIHDPAAVNSSLQSASGHSTSSRASRASHASSTHASRGGAVASGRSSRSSSPTRMRTRAASADSLNSFGSSVRASSVASSSDNSRSRKAGMSRSGSSGGGKSVPRAAPAFSASPLRSETRDGAGATRGIAMPSPETLSSAAGKSHKSKAKAPVLTASSFWNDYNVLGSGSVTAPKFSSSSSSSSSSAAAAVTASGSPSAPSSASKQQAKARPTPQVGTPDGFAKSRDADLQAVIQSLEDEFQNLNSQYRSLLKTVSSPGVTRPGGDPLESSFEADEKEGQLVDVIQRLHRKADMLKKLKSPTRA